MLEYTSLAQPQSVSRDLSGFGFRVSLDPIVWVMRLEQLAVASATLLKLRIPRIRRLQSLKNAQKAHSRPQRVTFWTPDRQKHSCNPSSASLSAKACSITST